MIVFDLIVIALIVFAAVRGYKKGLSDIILRLVGVIVTIVCAFMFKGAIADTIIKFTEFDDSLKSKIVEGINESIRIKADRELAQQLKEEGIVTEEKIEESSAFYDKLIENLNVEEGVEKLADNVVKFVFDALGFIIIFIVLSIIMFSLRMIFDMIFTIPVLSSINEVGGLIVGVLICVLKIWVVLAVCSMLAPVFPGISNMIDKTLIINLLYSNNFIVEIMSNGFGF